MKTSIATLFLLSWSLMCLSAEDDPFAGGAPDPPRPERKITSTPESIVYRKATPREHVYTVRGIYCNQKKGISGDGITYSVMIPDCKTVKLNYDKQLCTILTTRKLTNSELAYAVDDLARMGGEIPTWAELEARDIPKGEFFGDVTFTVKPFNGDVPKGLAWFWMDKRSVFSSPLSIGVGAPASLRIIPTTAHCMAHSRFSIRILDNQGKLVWHEDATAYAGVRIAMVDLDEDGIHEMLLDRDDHGKKARYVIQRK